MNKAVTTHFLLQQNVRLSITVALVDCLMQVILIVEVQNQSHTHSSSAKVIMNV